MNKTLKGLLWTPLSLPAAILWFCATGVICYPLWFIIWLSERRGSCGHEPNLFHCVPLIGLFWWVTTVTTRYVVEFVVDDGAHVVERGFVGDPPGGYSPFKSLPEQLTFTDNVTRRTKKFWRHTKAQGFVSFLTDAYVPKKGHRVTFNIREYFAM